MKKYKVTITETLQMEVEVDAPNRSEAERLVNRQWVEGDYILSEGLCGQLKKHRKKIMIRMSVG